MPRDRSWTPPSRVKWNIPGHRGSVQVPSQDTIYWVTQTVQTIWFKSYWNNSPQLSKVCRWTTVLVLDFVEKSHAYRQVYRSPVCRALGFLKALRLNSHFSWPSSPLISHFSMEVKISLSESVWNVTPLPLSVVTQAPHAGLFHPTEDNSFAICMLFVICVELFVFSLG